MIGATLTLYGQDVQGMMVVKLVAATDPAIKTTEAADFENILSIEMKVYEAQKNGRGQMLSRSNKRVTEGMPSEFWEENKLRKGNNHHIYH